MIAMRRPMAWLGLLFLVGCPFRSEEPSAQQPKTPRGADREAQGRPVEPTTPLKAAQEAFAELGARFGAGTDAGTKEMLHVFSMPPRTTDAELKMCGRAGRPGIAV